MPGMKLSLAITTFNRYQLTIDSFAQVINDPRIDDIILLDDCSTDGSYEKLRDYFNNNFNVRVIRQAQNRGMSLNKRDAIALAKNEFVIIFDSDNIIGPDYLDALDVDMHKNGRPPETWILMPSFAKPQFDYSEFSGKTFSKNRISNFFGLKMAECLINTCNFLVNRDAYLRVYEPNPRMKATDTAWFNYLWLKSGGSFYVVPGMEYYHRVHEGSGFMADVDYNMKQSEKIRQMIMAL